MRYYYEFENACIGPYDVLMHTEKEDAERIMKHFGYDILPDLIPKEFNRYHKNLYLFLLDTKTKTVSPMWSFNYAYGSGYNGYGPVGELLPELQPDLGQYTMRYFTPLEEKRCKAADRASWPDRRGPVFRDRLFER